MARNVTPLYRLADYLEKKVDPADFDMEFWDMCIAHYACKLFRVGKHHYSATGSRATEVLGLDIVTAYSLFYSAAIKTPQQAAKALRRLAETGQVYQ